MDKKYLCCFEEEVFINEKTQGYKNLCNFKNRPVDNEIYTKFYDCHLFRYLLNCKIEEKDKEKSITVILLNPSFADEYGLDRTLFNVKKFLKEQTNYSEFNVLNIFPIRTPNSKNLTEKMRKYKKLQEKNNEFIKKVISESNDVLIAWGSKYHKNAKWILDLLKDKAVYTYCINKDGSPRHFSPQAYNNAVKSFKRYTF